MDLLKRAAKPECVFLAGGQPPPCPEEWVDEPEKWCGSCLARAVLAKAGAHGDDA